MKRPDFSGYVLILDDYAMVAQGMGLQLARIGVADVVAVSNFDEALERIDGDTPPSFALVDFKLAMGETGLPVARRLSELRIPFVFVSGYGAAHPVMRRFSHAPILQKPVSDEVLANTFHSFFAPIQQAD